MHQLHPLWPWSGLRRALYVLLLLLSETRRPLLAASPSASAKVSKTRMEIREHDFSFSDGARERPVIEVVTKDVRTADIFNIMQGTRALVDQQRNRTELVSDGQHAVARCVDAAVEDAPMEEATSWWKDAVTEEFSRQDVVVLALITLCVLRLTVFVLQVTWKLVKLPMQWYAALDKEEEEEESRETRSEKQTSKWQMKQHEQHHRGARRRQRRLPSSEDPTDEVLLQLQELTKELPLGFTADMFTSLGNAMHENVVAAEPETSPAPSPQMETKPARAADTMHTSIVCAEAK